MAGLGVYALAALCAITVSAAVALDGAEAAGALIPGRLLTGILLACAAAPNTRRNASGSVMVLIIASMRSRNGEAIKVAEKLQGGGHANASGATLPKSIRTIDDAVEYLRTVMNPPKPVAINTLEGLFSAAEKK